MVGLASSLVGVGVVRMCVRAFSGRGWAAGFGAGSGGGLSGWGLVGLRRGGGVGSVGVASGRSSC